MPQNIEKIPLAYIVDARGRKKVPGQHQHVVTKGREAMGEERMDTFQA